MRGMAPRLLMGLSAVVMVTACIWPVSYAVQEDPVNQPPIIDPDSISVGAGGQSDVPEDGVYVWDVANNNAFEITLRRIRDDDVGDSLFVRWMIGRDPTSPFLDDFVAEEELLPTGGRDRRASFSFTSAALDEVDRARANAGQPVTGRNYWVDVYVGDRRPVFGGGPTDYPDDARVARWQWVLKRVNSGGGN